MTGSTAKPSGLIAEDAAACNHLRPVYRIANKIAGTIWTNQAKDGSILHMEMTNCLVGGLNRPEPTTPANPIALEITLPINTESFSETEVRTAISTLKNNQSSGMDGIIVEMLTSGGSRNGCTMNMQTLQPRMGHW